MKINLQQKKFIDEDVLKKIIKIGINFGERLNTIDSKCIDDFSEDKLYLKGEACYKDGYIYRAVVSTEGAWVDSRWVKVGDDITELDLDTIKSYLNLSSEDIAKLSDILLDTEVRLDKGWSSSCIYSKLQQCLDDSKAFTLKEISKLSGASYKVVTSTSEMTSESIIYLLPNATNYDMYIVETDGTATKIGDMDIDLSAYAKTADIETDFLKKTDATSTYTTQTTFNTHTSDTDIHTTATEKASYVKKTDIVDNLTSTDTDKPASAKQVKILDDKKLNKTDVNKINLTNLENVSLKEYILENCTEEKIYHFIARSNCTDTPKVNSHFYVIVEKVGSFTYKVTAKELGSNNNEYVCTYRSDLSIWTNWDKVVVGERNLNTFTDINQLGLTVPTTVREIFNAMPNFSLLRFQVDNSSVTDAPMPNGILIIDKIRSAKFTIEFKISADGSVADNGLYIGQLKGSDGSGLTWQRVVTEKEISELKAKHFSGRLSGSDGVIDLTKLGYPNSVNQESGIVLLLLIFTSSTHAVYLTNITTNDTLTEGRHYFKIAGSNIADFSKSGSTMTVSVKSQYGNISSVWGTLLGCK